MTKKPNAKPDSPVHVYQKDEVSLGNLQEKIDDIQSQGYFDPTARNNSRTFGQLIPPSVRNSEPSWTTERVLLAAFLVFMFLTFTLLGLIQSFAE